MRKITHYKVCIIIIIIIIIIILLYTVFLRRL